MAQDSKNPVWKFDFPMKQDGTARISRRRFAKIICLASGGLALGRGVMSGKTLFYSETDTEGEKLVCEASKVPVGEMYAFAIDDKKKKKCILIHLEKDKWRCFGQKCTHMGCSVTYLSDLKKIQCPCHKGEFDPDNGSVLKGPPSKPLPQLNVTVRDGKIYVTEKA